MGRIGNTLLTGDDGPKRLAVLAVAMLVIARLAIAVNGNIFAFAATDDKGQFIVITHVINDNGGTATAASFTMYVTGNGPTPNYFLGAESPGVTVTLNAGSYGIGQIEPRGYNTSFTGECAGIIAAGETRTCTVTNDDEPPRLSVNKRVVRPLSRPADRESFNLLIDGTTYVSNVGDGGSTGFQIVNAGAHSVGESMSSGTHQENYSSHISCMQGNGSPVVTSRTSATMWDLNLALAVQVRCTITNTALYRCGDSSPKEGCRER